MRLKFTAVVRAFAALDKVERKIVYATASVPANAVTLLWKLTVLVVAPSLAILSAALYTLGIAGAKVIAIRAHRAGGVDSTTHDQRDPHQVTYRALGWFVLSLSVTYIVVSALRLVILDRQDRYEPWAAILIAAIAFTELGFSLAGAIWARRHSELLIEAIRMANLAAALTLVALTQTAILSFTYAGDSRVHNAAAGILFGSLAAAIGVVMVTRRLPPAAEVRGGNSTLGPRSVQAGIVPTSFPSDVTAARASSSPRPASHETTPLRQ